MFDTIFGIPLHPLVVHATVVFVPLAALTSVLAVVWSRFRQWFGWGTPVIAAFALALDPVSTETGEGLEHALPRSSLIQQHAHLADGLLPWLIGLFLTSAVFYWRRRTHDQDGRGPDWVLRITGVLVVVAAVGTLVEVVLIGHSGAVAAWSKVG